MAALPAATANGAAAAPPLPPLVPAPSNTGGAALFKLAADCAAVIGTRLRALALPRASALALTRVRAAASPRADELEALTRGARSHREKCAVLLGAALNSRLALEQAAEGAAALDAADQLQLRRVCASLLGALRLGATRVRLYGRRVAPRRGARAPLLPRAACAASF
jgi:hypothetical protein